MKALLRKLLTSECGQDLIEYALLTAGVGLAGLGVWPLIVDSLGDVYVTLDNQTQDLWEPNNPGVGPPPP